MLAFSKEEFDIMIDELLYTEPIAFDMLCYIADKTLKNKVRYWCQTDDSLRGRSYEDDIMQEIYIRLMKTTIDHFLLKDGADGPVNNDPVGFSSWITTVADNLKKDFANRVRKTDFKTDDIDDPKLGKKLIFEEECFDDTRQEMLKQAFSVVLAADVSVYKVLTWLAQFIFVINYDITRIQSNREIIERFEQKTLFEMYDMLKVLSEHIEWVKISKTQDEKIMLALNRPWNESVVYGEVRYSEFFMKLNGKKSGKKSISDWVNRMDNMIRRKTGANFDITVINCEEGN